MNAKDTALVQKYAQSFVNTVNDREDIWSIYDEIAHVISIIKESDLTSLLNSEIISQEKKDEFVRTIRQSEYRVVNDLIEAVVYEENVALLSAVLEDVLRKISQSKNVYDAHITSVYPLNEEQKAKLCSMMEQKFSLKVRNVIEEQDKSLLGGFIISVSHRIIDASVRTQLREIKSKL